MVDNFRTSLRGQREDTINFRQLRYFVKVIEVGSFTRAAKELNVSQPALGLQIKQLEQDCELELLSRHSRGAIPTSAGLFLYGKSKAILDLVRETQRELTVYRQSPNEKVRIGLPRSIVRHLGSRLLLDAKTTIPNVFLQIIEKFNSDLLEGVRRNEIDIGLMYDVDSSRGVFAIPVLREDIVFVTASNETRCKGPSVRLQDALKGKLIFQRGHSLVKKAVEAAAVQHSIKLDIAFESQSPEAISEAVECGLAGAIVPYGIMSASIRSGLVVARRIVEPRIRRTLFLVRPQKQRPFKNDQDITNFFHLICERLIESLAQFSEPLQASCVPTALAQMAASPPTTSSD